MDHNKVGGTHATKPTSTGAGYSGLENQVVRSESAEIYAQERGFA